MMSLPVVPPTTRSLAPDTSGLGCIWATTTVTAWVSLSERPVSSVAVKVTVNAPVVSG